MPPGTPTLQVFQHVSDAGDATPVCRLDGTTAGLKRLCFEDAPAQAGTLAVWLKTASVEAAAVLLTYASPASAGVGALRVLNPTNLEVRFGGIGSGPTGIAVNDGVWHQLVVTYAFVAPSGYAVAVALDGVIAFQTNGLAGARAIAPGGDLYLGSGGTPASAIVADVSELQVWSRALNEREIGSGHLRRAAAGAAGLVLGWPLDVAPPGNPGAQVVPSTLRFRTGALRLGWTSVGSATGYEVEVATPDGLWRDEVRVPAVTSTSLPGRPVGTRLGGRVRALAGSDRGAWSPPVEIAVFELGQTAVALAWDAGASTLTAQWPDVARRDSFTLELYHGDDPIPAVTPDHRTLAYALTDKLDDPAGWLLAVRAAASGSLGPAQLALARTAPPAPRPRYALPTQTLTVEWDRVAGAEWYRLRIVPQSGPQQPFAVTLDEATTRLVLDHARYPLEPGTTYAVELRALGAGALTAWARTTIAIHDVPAPTLDWAAAAAPDWLDATWNEVAPGATYDLALYRGSEPDPVARRDASAARAYPLGTWLDADAGYHVLVSALDRGVLGPPNVPGAPQPLAPVVHYLAADHTLDVSWAQAQPSAYLRVYRGADTTPAASEVGSASHAVIPAPADQYGEGTLVTLKGRGLVPGAIGAVESGTVTVHLLTPPVPKLEYRELLEAAGTPSLTLAWPAINPPLAVAYESRTTVDGVAGPVTPVPPHDPPQLDVTALLANPGAITAAVRGTADGSIGGWSGGTPQPAPTLTGLVFDQETRRLDATWTVPPGLDHVCVELSHDGDAGSLQRHWLAGSALTTSFTVPAAWGTGTVRIGLRSVRGATLGAIATATMPLAAVPGPVLETLTSSLAPKQIVVPWEFDPQGATVLGFTADLSHDGTVLLHQEGTDPAARRTTFGETDSVHFVVNQTYVARVRARVQVAPGQVVLGAWSAPGSIVFGNDVDLALKTFDVTSDANGNLTLSWAMRTPLDSATFEASIPDRSFDRAGLTGTSAQLSRDATGVECDHEYVVKLRAVAAGATGPWSERTVTACKTPPPPPGPGTADPVNVRSGSFSYRAQDLVMPAVVPLVFRVAYRSDSPLPDDEHPLPSTPMGARWNHGYNVFIQRAADRKTVALIEGDLSVTRYSVPASITGSYPQQGIPDGSTLVVGADLRYTLTRRDQSVLRFDPNGRLDEIVDPLGNVTRLTYANGRLERVLDVGSGRSLALTYDAGGRVQTVTTSAGTAISYEYDEAGNLRLYTDPLGGRRRCTYASRSRIETMTNQEQRLVVRNEYDDQGRVRFQQDARALAEHATYGTAFAYSEDATQRTVVVTDPVDTVTTYVFDRASGLVKTETVGLAPGVVRRTSYTYDGNGNVLTRSVYEGEASKTTPVNTWVYTYDGANNVRTVTDPLGGVTTRTYDGANHVTSETDRLGNTTTIAYEGNLPKRVVDALGGTTTIDYHPGPRRGLPSHVTDPFGGVTQLFHDDLGQLDHVVDAAGTIRAWAYDERGWPSHVTWKDAVGTVVREDTIVANALGWDERVEQRYAGQPAGAPFTTVRERDHDGLLTAIVDPLTARLEGRYDPNGVLSKIIYPNTRQREEATSFGYDRADRLVRVDYGAGVVAELGYDPVGREAWVLDPRRNRTTVDYATVAGARGVDLVQTTTLPLNVPGSDQPQREQVRLDPLGRVVQTVDRAGGVMDLEYEAVPIAGTQAHGLKVVATLPPARQGDPRLTSSVTVDPRGHVIERVNEAARRTTWTYAPAASVPDHGIAVLAVTMTRPSGITELTLLDGLGRIVGVRRGTGARQRTLEIGRDALGRVVASTERGEAGAVGAATCAFAYDDHAIRATVEHAGRSGPVLRYDPLGNLLRATDRAGQSVAYTYTPSSQLESFTDARGQRLGYGYDVAGRLTETTLPGTAGSIVQVLDENGNRRQTLLGDRVQVTRAFDPLDRLLSRTGVDNDTIAYTYDALGGLATLHYPGAEGTSGAAPADPEATMLVRYGHDGLGRLTDVTDWAGRHTAYGYERTGELRTTDAPNGVHVEQRYDDDGRITALTTTMRGLVVADAAYGWNELDELSTLRELLPASARPAHGTRTFTYDGDRLTGVDGSAVTYDENGAMTSLPGVAGALATNVFGELVSAGPTTFSFDVDGLRVGASDGAGPRRYVHDVGGWSSPLREQAAPDGALTGAALRGLVPGGEALAPQLGGQQVSPLDALDRVLVEVGPGGTRRFVHGLGLIGSERPDGSWETHVFDGQGSTIALAAADGGISARHAYDAFGARIGGDPFTQPFGFVGRYGAMTDGSALTSMRARSYAPELLRFTSQDPLLGRVVQPQSLNRYVYAGNSPLLRIDPLGEDWSLAWKIPVAVGGTALLIAGIVYLPGILTTIGGGLTSAAGISGVLNPGRFRVGVSNLGRTFSGWGRSLRGRGPWRSGRPNTGPYEELLTDENAVDLDEFSGESTSSGSAEEYGGNVPSSSTGSQLGSTNGNVAQSLEDELLHSRSGLRQRLTSRASGGDDW